MLKFVKITIKAVIAIQNMAKTQKWHTIPACHCIRHKIYDRNFGKYNLSAVRKRYRFQLIFCQSVDFYAGYVL